ncbi:MAG: hypothetical protein KAU06_03465, partial [Candidatus Marinimicrobia bacterium]|nr:hypothetical protein [Candidatus Neomarinimicrobiota bacterium]
PYLWVKISFAKGELYGLPSKKRGTALAGGCVIPSNKLNEGKSRIFKEGYPKDGVCYSLKSDPPFNKTLLIFIPFSQNIFNFVALRKN